MHKVLINIFFLFVLVGQAIGQTEIDKFLKIKLTNKLDSPLIHFKNDKYIISFNTFDIQRICNLLNVNYEVQEMDTTELVTFIKTIDSTGKGNQANNYRLNSQLRELIDKGSVSVYYLSKKKYLKTIHKQIENVSAAGIIYYYLDHKIKIFQFGEANIGTPIF
jgi:hypothetical protein